MEEGSCRGKLRRGWRTKAAFLNSQTRQPSRNITKSVYSRYADGIGGPAANLPQRLHTVVAPVQGTPRREILVRHPARGGAAGGSPLHRGPPAARGGQAGGTGAPAHQGIRQQHSATALISRPPYLLNCGPLRSLMVIFNI